MAGVDLERALQLRDERRDDPHAEPLWLGAIETWRQAGAFITHGDRKPVSNACNGDPDRSARPVWVGILCGVSDEFVDDQGRRYGAIGGNLGVVLGVGANDARRNACREILADRLDILSKVHALDMGALKQLIVRPRHGRHAMGGFLEIRREGRIADRAGLQLKHAGDDHQAVLHPMAHLLE